MSDGFCDICGWGPALFYGCVCGTTHNICWECVKRYSLIDAPPPDPVSRTLAVCPDTVRVADAVMGKDDVVAVPGEPECPECGPTEWVCAIIKKVCAMCDADYPEEAPA